MAEYNFVVCNDSKYIDEAILVAELCVEKGTLIGVALKVLDDDESNTIVVALKSFAENRHILHVRRRSMS